MHMYINMHSIPMPAFKTALNFHILLRSQGVPLNIVPSIVSDEKIFKVLPIGVYVKKNRPFHKKVKVKHNVIMFSNLLGPFPNAVYQALGPLALWFRTIRFLKDFYHIWA